MSLKHTSHSRICHWIFPGSTMQSMMTCLQLLLTLVILQVGEEALIAVLKAYLLVVPEILHIF